MENKDDKPKSSGRSPPKFTSKLSKVGKKTVSGGVSRKKSRKKKTQRRIITLNSTFSIAAFSSCTTGGSDRKKQPSNKINPKSTSQQKGEATREEHFGSKNIGGEQPPKSIYDSPVPTTNSKSDNRQTASPPAEEPDPNCLAKASKTGQSDLPERHSRSERAHTSAVDSDLNPIGKDPLPPSHRMQIPGGDSEGTDPCLSSPSAEKGISSSPSSESQDKRISHRLSDRLTMLNCNNSHTASVPPGSPAANRSEESTSPDQADTPAPTMRSKTPVEEKRNDVEGTMNVVRPRETEIPLLDDGHRQRGEVDLMFQEARDNTGVAPDEADTGTPTTRTTTPEEEKRNDDERSITQILLEDDGHSHAEEVDRMFQETMDSMGAAFYPTRLFPTTPAHKIGPHGLKVEVTGDCDSDSIISTHCATTLAYVTKNGTAGNVQFQPLLSVSWVNPSSRYGLVFPSSNIHIRPEYPNGQKASRPLPTSMFRHIRFARILVNDLEYTISFTIVEDRLSKHNFLKGEQVGVLATAFNVAVSNYQQYPAFFDLFRSNDAAAIGQYELAMAHLPTFQVRRKGADTPFHKSSGGAARRADRKSTGQANTSDKPFIMSSRHAKVFLTVLHYVLIDMATGSSGKKYNSAEFGPWAATASQETIRQVAELFVNRCICEATCAGMQHRNLNCHRPPTISNLADPVRMTHVIQEWVAYLSQMVRDRYGGTITSATTTDAILCVDVALTIRPVIPGVSLVMESARLAHFVESLRTAHRTCTGFNSLRVNVQTSSGQTSENYNYWENTPGPYVFNLDSWDEKWRTQWLRAPTEREIPIMNHEPRPNFNLLHDNPSVPRIEDDNEGDDGIIQELSANAILRVADDAGSLEQSAPTPTSPTPSPRDREADSQPPSDDSSYPTTPIQPTRKQNLDLTSSTSSAGPPGTPDRSPEESGKNVTGSLSSDKDSQLHRRKNRNTTAARPHGTNLFQVDHLSNNEEEVANFPTATATPGPQSNAEESVADDPATASPHAGSLPCPSPPAARSPIPARVRTRSMVAASSQSHNEEKVDEPAATSSPDVQSNGEGTVDDDTDNVSTYVGSPNGPSPGAGGNTAPVASRTRSGGAASLDNHDPDHITIAGKSPAEQRNIFFARLLSNPSFRSDTQGQLEQVAEGCELYGRVASSAGDEEDDSDLSSFVRNTLDSSAHLWKCADIAVSARRIIGTERRLRLQQQRLATLYSSDNGSLRKMIYDLERENATLRRKAGEIPMPVSALPPVDLDDISVSPPSTPADDSSIPLPEIDSPNIEGFLSRGASQLPIPQTNDDGHENNTSAHAAPDVAAVHTHNGSPDIVVHPHDISGGRYHAVFRRVARTDVSRNGELTYLRDPADPYRASLWELQFHGENCKAHSQAEWMNYHNSTSEDTSRRNSNADRQNEDEVAAIAAPSHDLPAEQLLTETDQYWAEQEERGLALLEPHSTDDSTDDLEESGSIPTSNDPIDRYQSVLREHGSHHLAESPDGTHDVDPDRPSGPGTPGPSQDVLDVDAGTPVGGATGSIGEVNYSSGEPSEEDGPSPHASGGGFYSPAAATVSSQHSPGSNERLCDTLALIDLLPKHLRRVLYSQLLSNGLLGNFHEDKVILSVQEAQSPFFANDHHITLALKEQCLRGNLSGVNIYHTWIRDCLLKQVTGNRLASRLVEAPALAEIILTRARRSSVHDYKEDTEEWLHLYHELGDLLREARTGTVNALRYLSRNDRNGCRHELTHAFKLPLTSSDRIQFPNAQECPWEHIRAASSEDIHAFFDKLSVESFAPVFNLFVRPRDKPPPKFSLLTAEACTAVLYHLEKLVMLFAPPYFRAPIHDEIQARHQVPNCGWDQTIVPNCVVRSIPAVLADTFGLMYGLDPHLYTSTGDEPNDHSAKSYKNPRLVARVGKQVSHPKEYLYHVALLHGTLQRFALNHGHAHGLARFPSQIGVFEEYDLRSLSSMDWDSRKLLYDEVSDHLLSMYYVPWHTRLGGWYLDHAGGVSFNEAPEIFPPRHRRDWDEISSHLAGSLSVGDNSRIRSQRDRRPVTSIDEVLNIMFLCERESVDPKSGWQKAPERKLFQEWKRILKRLSVEAAHLDLNLQDCPHRNCTRFSLDEFKHVFSLSLMKVALGEDAPSSSPGLLPIIWITKPSTLYANLGCGRYVDLRQDQVPIHPGSREAISDVVTRFQFTAPPKEVVDLTPIGKVQDKFSMRIKEYMGDALSSDRFILRAILTHWFSGMSSGNRTSDLLRSAASVKQSISKVGIGDDYLFFHLFPSLASCSNKMDTMWKNYQIKRIRSVESYQGHRGFLTATRQVVWDAVTKTVNDDVVRELFRRSESRLSTPLGHFGHRVHTTPEERQLNRFLERSLEEMLSIFDTPRDEWAVQSDDTIVPIPSPLSNPDQVNVQKTMFCEAGRLIRAGVLSSKVYCIYRTIREEYNHKQTRHYWYECNNVVTNLENRKSNGEIPPDELQSTNRMITAFRKWEAHHSARDVDLKAPNVFRTNFDKEFKNFMDLYTLNNATPSPPTLQVPASIDQLQRTIPVTARNSRPPPAAAAVPPVVTVRRSNLCHNEGPSNKARRTMECPTPPPESDVASFDPTSPLPPDSDLGSLMTLATAQQKTVAARPSRTLTGNSHERQSRQKKRKRKSVTQSPASSSPPSHRPPPTGKWREAPQTKRKRPPPTSASAPQTKRNRPPPTSASARARRRRPPTTPLSAVKETPWVSVMIRVQWEEQIKKKLADPKYDWKEDIKGWVRSQKEYDYWYSEISKGLRKAKKDRNTISRIKRSKSTPSTPGQRTLLSSTRSTQSRSTQSRSTQSNRTSIHRSSHNHLPPSTDRTCDFSTSSTAEKKPAAKKFSETTTTSSDSSEDETDSSSSPLDNCKRSPPKSTTRQTRIVDLTLIDSSSSDDSSSETD